MSRAALALSCVLAFACAEPAVAQDGGWLCGTNSEGEAEWTGAGPVRIAFVRDAEVPLVSFHVRIPGGVAQEPAGVAGRAALLAEWVSRGAGGLGAEAFREAVESRGGRLRIYASGRWIGIDAEFASEDAEYGHDLVWKTLFEPTFDPEELRKARDLTLQRLKHARTEPSEVIGTYWRAWLHGAHPFGNPTPGDETTVPQVAEADALRDHWRRLTLGNRVHMVIAGDVSNAMHRAWSTASEGPVPLPPPAKGPGSTFRPGRVLLVDHPGSLQTYFRFGGPGIPRDDPDHAARYLANTILGGRFTSRLNTALRIEAGLTYGARSSFDDARGGAFAVNTYTETATSKECIDLAREVYAAFVTKGMTAEELDSARKYVKGQFAPDELETPEQRAAWKLDLTLSGMSYDFIDGFFERLDAVTLEAVNRVITERFPKDGMNWVLVGQAEVLRPIAKDLGDVTEVKLADPGFGPRD